MLRRSPLDEGALARPKSLAAALSLSALALTGCATTLDGAASARRARARLSAPEFTVPSRSARIQRETNGETSIPPDGADLTSWSAALDALLNAPPGTTRGAIAPARPWDHITAPRYIDRIDRRLSLSATDHEALSREGFAVLDRARASSWIEAWQIARQADLPIYVSADSILAAATSLHGPFVEHVEEHTLAPKLAQVLQRMHDALPSAARAMPDEASTDVDLILTVARSLLELDEGTVPAALGTQPAATELVNAARSGARRAERYLFGRPRVLDFTDYAPTARRSLSRPLARYARATAWLSRVELNLVSRGCRSSHPGPTADPRETPREALTALALADLVERAGVSDDLARLERAWTLLDGRRNDVSLAQINVLRDDVHIVDLRASDTFERFRLVARNVAEGAQPSFPGVARGPAVASLFGLRRTALDAARIEGPVRAAEAAYALGADRALTFLEGSDHTALASARSSNATLAENDLPSHWLRALRGLAAPPSGRAPSFVTTDAFADLRVNAVLASFGRYLDDGDAAPTPAAGAPLGTSPTGWVDPTPETYRSIATYAERSLAVARAMFEWTEARSAATRDRDRAFLRAYDALWRVSRGLRIIADDELAGRTPTEEQRAFVTAVVDDGDASNNVATRGWYASMAPPGEGTQTRAAYAATLGASSQPRERVWIGASSPRLGVFVIDNGGLPFAAVGPIARAWEAVAPASMSAAQVAARAPSTSPWSTSWMISQEPAPPLSVTVVDDDARRRAVMLRGGRDLGRVTIELLDARGTVIGDATRVVGDAPQRVVLARRVVPQVRSRHARHHAHRGDGIGVRYIDNTRSPGAPQTLRIRTAGFWFEQPTRFERNEHFALGGAAPVDASGAPLPESASE